jgi:hypothetical protein
MLGLQSDPIVDTGPGDAETVMLVVSGEGESMLLDEFELSPITCRGESFIRDSRIE